MNSLVGNIGGYVGLLMGVSVSQLPYLVLQIHKHMKNVIHLIQEKMYQDSSV